MVEKYTAAALRRSPAGPGIGLPKHGLRTGRYGTFNRGANPRCRHTGFGLCPENHRATIEFPERPFRRWTDRARTGRERRRAPTAFPGAGAWRRYRRAGADPKPFRELPPRSAVHVWGACGGPAAVSLQERRAGETQAGRARARGAEAADKQVFVLDACAFIALLEDEPAPSG